MDYKKMHEEILNKLQWMVSNGKITEKDAKSICSDFVPESDDERIKNDIMEAVENWFPYERVEEIRAYLRKQKSTKSVSKFKVGDIINYKGGIYEITNINMDGGIPFYSVRALNTYPYGVIGIGVKGEDFMMKIGYIERE